MDNELPMDRPPPGSAASSLSESKMSIPASPTSPYGFQPPSQPPLLASEHPIAPMSSRSIVACGYSSVLPFVLSMLPPVQNRQGDSPLSEEPEENSETTSKTSSTSSSSSSTSSSSSSSSNSRSEHKDTEALRSPSTTRRSSSTDSSDTSTAPSRSKRSSAASDESPVTPPPSPPKPIHHNLLSPGYKTAPPVRGVRALPHAGRRRQEYLYGSGVGLQIPPLELATLLSPTPLPPTNRARPPTELDEIHVIAKLSSAARNMLQQVCEGRYR